MVIAHNLSAMNSKRQYGVVSTDRSKNTEKLSSGYKINRAADDAAGLTISEKMRSQIRGLTQASDNAQDGVSFVQIADGALAEVQDMLHRMTELTVKAANGTNTEEDRSAIQKEIAELTHEIDRVHESSEFNTIKTFSDAGHSPAEGLSDVSASRTLEIGRTTYEFEYIGADGLKQPAVADSSASGYDNKAINEDYKKFVVDSASNAVSLIASKYPDLMSGAASDNIKIGLNVANIDGSSNTLASAKLSMSYTSSWTQMSYTLNIDSSDYDPAKFDSATAAKKANLGATIAHEMTHHIMYDTLTNGMLSNNSNSFPKWFVEGMAQTSSGDNGWVTIDGTNDARTKSYMSQINSMPYGAGYLATMALGYEIAKAKDSTITAPSSQNISSGLNELFKEMTNQGASLDGNAAIQAATNGKYTSFSNFASSFASGSADLLNDVKDILAETGSGAGSLLGSSLSDSETSLFGSPVNSGSTNYVIDPSNTQFTNSYGAGFNVPSSKGDIENAGGDLILQVGAENRAEQQIALKRFNMSSDSIFAYKTVDCSNQDSAKASIDIVNDAVSRVSNVRSYYGAMQNRLEHTIKNLDNVVENTQAAESRIRDTDMAKEMVEFSKNNILMQAGESMMAQANQSTQGVLSLLQ